MDWVETNGVVLRYELSGTGHMPLLLIHELGGSLEFWDPVLPAFQQAFQCSALRSAWLRYVGKGQGRCGSTTCWAISSASWMPSPLPSRAMWLARRSGLALRWPLRPGTPRVCAVWWSVVPPQASLRSGSAPSLQRAETVERGGMRVAVERAPARAPTRSASVATGSASEQYQRRWLANDPEGFAAINRMLTEMDLTTIRTYCLSDPGDWVYVRHHTPAAGGGGAGALYPGGRGTSRSPVAILCRTRPRNCSLETVLPFLQGS